MPTYDKFDSFRRDWNRLSDAHKALFLAAMRMFVEDLRGTDGFRKGLRVKGVQGKPGVFEMTWSMTPDGRATFEYGDEVRAGEPHIVWRRIGGHDIFKDA